MKTETFPENPNRAQSESLKSYVLMGWIYQNTGKADELNISKEEDGSIEEGYIRTDGTFRKA